MAHPILNNFLPCARIGCIQPGRWLPVLKIRLIGQTDEQKPVTLGIPMVLCDKHKADFSPRSSLTHQGWKNLKKKVKEARKREINMDTVDVEWRDAANRRRIQLH